MHNSQTSGAAMLTIVHMHVPELCQALLLEHAFKHQQKFFDRRLIEIFIRNNYGSTFCDMINVK